MKLQLSAKLKIKLTKVFWITLIWTIIGSLEALYIHAVSGDDTFLERATGYDFYHFLKVNTFFSFLGGLIAGGLLIFYLRGRFRKQSFGVAVFINSIIITLIILGTIAFGHMIYSSLWSNTRLFSRPILAGTLDFFTEYFFFKTFFLWLIVTLLTILMLHVNEKYGPGVLRQLIMGKYHHPREEERIFMFLDMKSSTAVAEKIGHIRFFELLNDFFRDITDPIIYAQGSIYQYIGDEVVIVWKIPKGARNANCIRCFYNIRAAISNKKDYYMKSYGVVPDFKAALHCGKVTIGEIGVYKRDIVFSGDVLNTTARIQGMCNDFGVKILVTKRLLDKVALPPDSYEAKRIGNISLKGKKKKVVLYTIEEEPMPVLQKGYF